MSQCFAYVEQNYTLGPVTHTTVAKLWRDSQPASLSKMFW